MKKAAKKPELPVLAIGIMGRRKDAPAADEAKKEDGRAGVLADLAGEMRSAKSDQAFAEALEAFIMACDEGEGAEDNGDY